MPSPLGAPGALAQPLQGQEEEVRCGVLSRPEDPPRRPFPAYPLHPPRRCHPGGAGPSTAAGTGPGPEKPPAMSARNGAASCGRTSASVGRAQGGDGPHSPTAGAEPPALRLPLTLASFSICLSSSGTLDADVSAWGRDGICQGSTGGQARDPPEGSFPASAPPVSGRPHSHPTSSSLRDFRPRLSSSSSISKPVSSVRRELRRRRPSSRPVISDSGRPVFLARATFNLPRHSRGIRCLPPPTPCSPCSPAGRGTRLHRSTGRVTPETPQPQGVEGKVQRPQAGPSRVRQGSPLPAGRHAVLPAKRVQAAGAAGSPHPPTCAAGPR